MEKLIPTLENLEENKKRKNIKDVVEGSSQQKKPKKDDEFTYYFYKKSRHMKKHCPKYVAWCVKKYKFLALVCSKAEHQTLAHLDCPTKARPYRTHERKLNLGTVMCYIIGYVEHSRGYKFYDPTSRSLFEMKNVRFLEEVEFEKEDIIRNVFFEKESINDIGKVLVPITIQETTPVIKDNIQTIVPNIVPKQNYDEFLFQTPIDFKDNIEIYKVRLVAKGFTKKEDIGYKETFSLRI
ncbi:hypothetical protein CR513_02525, partial [Mucuna pruriens]